MSDFIVALWEAIGFGAVMLVPALIAIILLIRGDGGEY